MPVASVLRVGARVLVIDNYDSFVYNLVQYLGELGAEPMVHRHDAVDLAAIAAGCGAPYTVDVKADDELDAEIDLAFSRDV